MNILALDTATEYLSLALSVDGTVSTAFEKVENKLSNNIIPYIQTLLKQQDLAISDLNLITYNQGPGSFTGLRIGLSVALGIAYGLDIQLIPIPAFMLHAAKFNIENLGSQQIVVGLDARLGQMYYAGVNLPDFSYFIQPQLINPQDIDTVDDVKFCGNGFILYQDQLPAKIIQRMNAIPDCHSFVFGNPGVDEQLNNKKKYPSAKYLIELVNSGKFKAVKPADADVLYLRNKIALNVEEQLLLRLHR